MIRNPMNWNFLGGGLGRFRQKHIVLTLSTERIDKQSQKAYHFCARAVLK